MLIDIQVWCRKCAYIDTVERLDVPAWRAARDPIAARAVGADKTPWACPNCGCTAGFFEYIRNLDAEDHTPKERMALKESQYHQCFKITSDAVFKPPANFRISLKNPETKAEL